MKHLHYALLLTLALTATGCYHATVTTGLTPGNVVIDKPWAMGFVYGLVPPSTVEVAEECPNGVAMVETQLSFLNQIVSAVTFGIVTPMQITVTCAASGSASAILPGQEIRIDEGATRAEVIDAFGKAADQAVASEQPIYVRFERAAF